MEILRQRYGKVTVPNSLFLCHLNFSDGASIRIDGLRDAKAQGAVRDQHCHRLELMAARFQSQVRVRDIACALLALSGLLPQIQVLVLELDSQH